MQYWSPDPVAFLVATDSGTDKMEAIRFEDVGKAYDGNCALAGVTVGIVRDAVTAIIGPNGAGKTTLINVLTGFLRPDSGRCFVGGEETTGKRPESIARLGVARTFQDVRIVRQVSALENLLLARPHQSGERLWNAVMRRGGWRTAEARNRQAAQEYLELCGLEHKAAIRAGELSYGQQKLLSLLMCMGSEKRILILDEPVAGVDPEMKQRILKVLAQMGDQGRTVVFIEHDLDAVRRVADEVIVMDAGTVLLKGEPKEVLEQKEILEAYVA